MCRPATMLLLTIGLSAHGPLWCGVCHATYLCTMAVSDGFVYEHMFHLSPPPPMYACFQGGMSAMPLTLVSTHPDGTRTHFTPAPPSVVPPEVAEKAAGWGVRLADYLGLQVRGGGGGGGGCMDRRGAFGGLQVRGRGACGQERGPCSCR